jgi:hypothetical protein
MLRVEVGAVFSSRSVFVAQKDSRAITGWCGNVAMAQGAWMGVHAVHDATHSILKGKIAYEE